MKEIKKGELGKAKFVDYGDIEKIKFTVDRTSMDYDKQPIKHNSKKMY